MSEPSNIVKLHLSGSIGMASQLDKQKIWIFHWKETTWTVWNRKKFLQMAVLGYIFIYEQTEHYLGDDNQLHSW